MKQTIFFISFILFTQFGFASFFSSKSNKKTSQSSEGFITIEESNTSSITLNRKYVKYVIQVKNRLNFFIVGERSPIEFEFETSKLARDTKNSFFGLKIAGVNRKR